MVGTQKTTLSGEACHPSTGGEYQQAEQLEKEELIRRQNKRIRELEKDVKLLTDATIFFCQQRNK